MKCLLPLVLLILLPRGALAAPRVVGAKSYQLHEPIVLRATDVSSDKAQFLWDVSGAANVIEAGSVLYVWAPAGTYTVRLTAIDFETKKVERTRFTFTVGDGPTPEPVPPKPTPVGTFDRVLIVYDDAARATMPKAQEAVLWNKSVHDLLKAKTLKDAANPNGAWRIYDKGADAADKAWADLMARPRASVPWIILASGATVTFEGPLPANVADTLALLGKYAPKSQRKAG